MAKLLVEEGKVDVDASCDSLPQIPANDGPIRTTCDVAQRYLREGSRNSGASKELVTYLRSKSMKVKVSNGAAESLAASTPTSSVSSTSSNKKKKKQRKRKKP